MLEGGNIEKSASGGEVGKRRRGRYKRLAECEVGFFFVAFVAVTGRADMPRKDYIGNTPNKTC